MSSSDDVDAFLFFLRLVFSSISFRLDASKSVNFIKMII